MRTKQMKLDKGHEIKYVLKPLGNSLCRISKKNPLKNEFGRVKIISIQNIIIIVLSGAILYGYQPDIKGYILEGAKIVEKWCGDGQTSKEIENNVVIEKKVSLGMDEAIVVGDYKDIRATVKDIKEHFRRVDVSPVIANIGDNFLVDLINKTLTKREINQTVYADVIIGYDFTKIINSPQYRTDFAIADNEKKTITILIPPAEVLYVKIDEDKVRNNNAGKINDGDGLFASKDVDYFIKVDAERQAAIEKMVISRFERNEYKNTDEIMKFKAAKDEAEKAAVKQYKMHYCNGKYKNYDVILETLTQEQTVSYEQDALTWENKK